MGFDKALLRQKDGRLLPQVLADKLASRFGQVALACGNPDKLNGFAGLEPYQLIADEGPFCGPAAAIATALSSLGDLTLFVMAGDMPTVDWGVIVKLADLIEAGAEAAIPQHGGKPEPLYAFYSQAAKPFLAESACCGKGSLREVFPKLRTAFLDLNDTDLSPGLFANLNTPSEAEEAGFPPFRGNLNPNTRNSSD
jgi:molybdopterin-guanine dinucleotide biosynthesis protein A